MARPFLAALVFSLLAMCAPPAQGADPGKITKEKFTFGDQVVSYFLYVPRTVSAQAPAPLLLLLHGSGRDGRVLIDEWKKLADKEGIVLVGPNAQDAQAWYIPTDGPGPVCGLVSQLRKTLPIDARRTYLFGHSAGAVFGLNLAMLESEYFAAAAVHAGAWRSPDELDAARYAVRKIPISIFVGDQDRFFPVPAVEATAAALKEQEVPLELEVIRGHDHNYYAISSRINQSAWAFLKGRHLDSDPKYTQHVFSR
jgi:poly(3-hydroxybutyrate) depolymerase